MFVLSIPQMILGERVVKMTILATIDPATRPDSEAAPASAHVLGPHAPFAYQFAAPISDPVNPDTLPRLGTHGTTTIYTSCDSSEWCYSFHDS